MFIFAEGSSPMIANEEARDELAMSWRAVVDMSFWCEILMKLGSGIEMKLILLKLVKVDVKVEFKLMPLFLWLLAQRFRLFTFPSPAQILSFWSQYFHQSHCQWGLLTYSS